LSLECFRKIACANLGWIMKLESLDAHRENAVTMLALARKNYRQVLDLLQEDSIGRRLATLFDADEAFEKAAPAAPYDHFIPGFRLTYNGDDGAQFAIAQVKPAEHAHPEARDFVVRRVADGLTDWLALEFTAPWSELRAGRKVTLTAFGSAAAESYFDLQIYCRTVNEERRELLIDKPTGLIQPKMGAIRLEGEYALPKDPIDFSVEPEIAVFIDPKVSEFLLSDIDVFVS